LEGVENQNDGYGPSSWHLVSVGRRASRKRTGVIRSRTSDNSAALPTIRKMAVLPSKLSLTLNAYMPGGLSDSTPIQNLLVLRSANFGRNLHAFFPTAANSRCFVQSGDREPTALVEQNSSPRPHGPFFTKYGAVGSSIAASTCSPIGLNQVRNSVFPFDFRPVGFQ